MSRPGVDVIVPCFNYGRYLRSCTASVLQETRTPVRVLIIDDASSDDSADIAEAIAREDARVQVVRHTANRGHIATFNEGLAWASADYLLLLSADDMVAPGALARAVAVMEAHPETALTCGRALRFRCEEEVRRAPAQMGAPSARIVEGREFIRSICADALNPVETATAVVRTTVQKRVGGYRPELPHSGDLEMWLRCAAQGSVAVIGEVQGLVRFHDANMRDTYRGESDFLQRRAAFEAFFDQGPAGLPGARALRRQALRSLSDELVGAATAALEHDRPHAGLIRLAGRMSFGVRRSWPWWKYWIKRRLRFLQAAPQAARRAADGRGTPTEPDGPALAPPRSAG